MGANQEAGTQEGKYAGHQHHHPLRGVQLGGGQRPRHAGGRGQGHGGGPGSEGGRARRGADRQTPAAGKGREGMTGQERGGAQPGSRRSNAGLREPGPARPVM